MGTCETCRFWARGSIYFINPYGNTPRRAAWTTQQDVGYAQQAGECRIVAPHHSDGGFPGTYEFQGCGEHEPLRERDDGR